jgi:hypothetical protein
LYNKINERSPYAGIIGLAPDSNIGIGRFYFGSFMRQFLSTFEKAYAGKPAAVLGGGPSLLTDMKLLPAGCLLFAVNYHAFYFCKPKFMVYNDDPETDGMLMHAVKTVGALKCSPDQKTTDVIFDVEVWTGSYSSNTATWLALYMGCNPVILCGMDLYQGVKKYCHEFAKPSFIHDYPLEHHLRPWVEEARASCPHPERIKAMSGPLVDVFGKYEPR